VVPGSAVSAQLVRGDLEIAATCTVTYIDPKQLLACGHPVLQAGPISLPMTSAEVVATLASPLNAFKIVNTGPVIGAFTQDRDAAIRGVLGEPARMIPVHLRMHGAGRERRVNVEVLDLAGITPQAVLVTLFSSLLESNDSTAETSYHLTGSVHLDGYPAAPLDLWAPGGEGGGAALAAALLAGERFSRLYSNPGRMGLVRAVDLDVESIPRRVDLQLDGARLVSGDIVRAGQTVEVEATLRPWRQPARNLRISFKVPARLGPGNLRILVSDAGTLDRTLDQPRQTTHPPSLDAALAQAARLHPGDRLYVSLLTPDAQAGLEGQTLTTLPLSMANALEPLRSAQEASLHGESAELAAEAEAGGIVSGYAVLNLRIDPGGGLN
ncbi:MAG: SpoIVB peptidase S55, partial [Terracidiphilus sp.]